MKITVLIENTAVTDIETEHGLSLYVETCGRKILFDMGQTDMLERNAAHLGVKLSDIDTAVLSHGHYDHGGGLEKFLEINKRAPVYITRSAFEPHYNGTEKYIGLDVSLKDSNRLIFSEDTCKICEEITLYTCNSETREHNLGSFGLNMVQNGEYLPDDFRHEQYMLVNEGSRRVLFSGCSHKGIMDIVRWFRPDVLIGGFHFSKLPLDEKLAEYASYLNGFDTEFYTCHCTGTEQYEFMKKHMHRLNYIHCGDTISL